MLTVRELLAQLSYGELSNLSLGLDGTGDVDEDRLAKIISYVNDGLLRLHTRFVLKENDLALICLEHITRYRLSSDYAMSNTDESNTNHRYIFDVTEPFQDDVIKITRVSNSGGEAYPLNDVEHTDSLFTPQPNVLQVPAPETDMLLGVLYQAKHPTVPYNDLTFQIDIPYVLEEALKSYIAHKVYSHMNGQENSIKAKDYLSTFNSLCMEVTDGDLIGSSTSSTNVKFSARGFR